MSSVTIHPVQPEAWRAAVRALRDYNYRQIWEYGVACAARVAARSEHVLFCDGATVLGAADVRVKRIPGLGTGIAYLNGAPMVRRGQADDATRLQRVVVALVATYVRERGLVLRVAPQLGDPAWNAEQGRIFQELGFQPSAAPGPYRTFVVDLAPPVEEIRKRLKQKWRNGLNGAERHNLTVRQGGTAEFFEAFAALYDETVARKGFSSPLDATFYAQVQTTTPAEDAFVVTLVEHEGAAVAGHVGSSLGDTCVYILGASNEAALKLKATYLLQWHVLCAARDRGCAWYDLGGIDPEANPGVYHFKEGLGGTDVTAPGPYELYPAALNARLVGWAERAYRWWHGSGRRTQTAAPPRPMVQNAPGENAS